MSNVPGQYTPHEINHIFANLQPHDVEQFYAVYQQWLRQRTIANLQAQIASLRNQVAENNLRIQQVQPSPLALSTLARLQSKGVTNLDLLDHMVDQGEAWLASAMQHLDYCEQFDFIRGNYTEWCEHALEGAYDWIDSMQELDATDAAGDAGAANNDNISTASSASPQPGEQFNEATEEIFLQKLMSEEDVSLLDTPQEIAIVSSTAQEVETSTPVANIAGVAASNETLSSTTANPAAELAEYTRTSAAESPPGVDTISGSTVIPTGSVPDTEQPEAGLAEHTPADTVDTVDTVETSATPHLPLEQGGTIEPKAIEHEAVAAETASDEVVDSPDAPEVEEATAPLISVVTPPKAISDVTTIPVIPAAEASPPEHAVPTARSPRKRNFIQLLFRRKPK